MKKDFLLDIHTHTLVSGHAYGTIREMAKAASEQQMCIRDSLCRPLQRPGNPDAPAGGRHVPDPSGGQPHLFRSEQQDSVLRLALHQPDPV